jgi:hypothetical protein
MASSYRGQHARGPDTRTASAGRPGRHARGTTRFAARRNALLLACAAVLVAAYAVLPGATATSVTTKLAPVADAKVSRRLPTRNFGSDPTLRTAPSPKVERSYLRFDVAGITGPVTSASLRLYAETASLDGFAVRTVATTPWSEGTITYANAPTPGPIVATSGPVAGDGWTSVDVSALVRGAGRVDLVLTSNGRSSGLYASRETGVTAPQLVVAGATTTSVAPTTTGAATTTTGGSGTTTTSTASTRPAPSTTGAPAASSASPPPAGGYFALAGPGGWAALPSGAACQGRVHRSTWEPRPDNAKRNHLTPDPAAVHAALAARPRAAGGAYDPRWDGWLLARVDGQFTGTTDEVFQWAACKWGLPDDLLRAVAVQESTWYQYLTYPSGRPVPNYGSGDVFGAASAASRVFCTMVAGYGYDYQRDLGAGICPQTFSIVGLKSWQDPAWGAWPGNQNGTFPFARDSTAFAVDYLGGELRGCYEGWESWLGEGASGYGAGDLWGCVGSWFSGDWHSAAANGYAADVRRWQDTRPWLAAGWPADKPGCTQYGCPGPDPL